MIDDTLRVSNVKGLLDGAHIAALIQSPGEVGPAHLAVAGNTRHLLQSEGAHIQAYDPVAMANAQLYLHDVDLCQDAYDAAKGADALVIVTEWNEFKQLDLVKIKGSMKQPVIVDGSSTQVSHGETASETGAMLGMNSHAMGCRHDLILGEGNSFMRDMKKGIDEFLELTSAERAGGSSGKYSA